MVRGALCGLALVLAVGHTSACQRGSARKEAIEAARKQGEDKGKAQVNQSSENSIKAKAKAKSATKLAQAKKGAIPETIEVADCKALVSRVCADLGEEHLGCTLSREKLPAVGDAECKRLGPRYGALIADLQVRDKIRKDAKPEDMRRMMSMGNPPSFGPKSAPVQVVEFLDFECSGCSRLDPAVKSVKDKVGKGGAWENKVHYVVRMKPLFEMHDNAILAAQAALAAQAQGKYWEYQDLLFANQSDLSRGRLMEMAKTAKLDMKRFAADLESGKVKDTVAKDLELATQVTAMATPTIFVNGKRVHPGVFELNIAQAIEKAAVAR